MKKNIGIIFGGKSPEYHVSLESAYAVITNMDIEKFNPIIIGITSCGEWFYYKGNVDHIIDDSWWLSKDCISAMISPNTMEQGLIIFNSNQITKIHLDAIFPVMHGKYGEDGCIQGLIECSGIPCIGCGVLSSSLCMDKYRAHKLVSEQGVKVANSYLINKSNKLDSIKKKASIIGYPLYVKPLRAGSSFGVSKVKEEKELQDAITLAYNYGDEILLEENIEGFEIGCSIVGRNKLILGAIDEIDVTNGFFNYDEKYHSLSSKTHVPARITKEKTKEIEVIAKKIYRILNCEVFARVDLFLTPMGEIVFNEVNTIPGFTSHSRFPNMMKEKGYTFKELITKIIEVVI